MRCKAYVPSRPYSPPGPCQVKKNVRLVRWAPTPLTTQVIKGLCTTHRRMLEAGKALKVGRAP